MRKTKEQRAITLIALIITIVVLLILAAVAINAVTGDGIIQHATNARDSYENAQAKEKSVLSYYETYLETEGKKGKWIQEGTTLKTTNSDGTITEVKIGDYVNYNEGSHTHTPDATKGIGTSGAGGNASSGYILNAVELSTEDLKWRVLGVNDRGELELISENPTTQTIFLANDVGYINAENNLNNLCDDLYGQGTNNQGKKVATGARSLDINDIDKLTKYDKNSYSEYGNKWTYKYPTDAEVSAGATGLTKNMWYKTEKKDGTVITNWSNITDSTYQTFRMPGEATIISESNRGSKELTYTFYGYDIPSNLTTEDGYTSEEITEISNMITKGTQNSNLFYWLASKGVRCEQECASFCVQVVYEGGIARNGLFKSYVYNYGNDRSVRPVVSISTNFSLTGSGEELGSVSNMWNIS